MSEATPASQQPAATRPSHRGRRERLDARRLRELVGWLAACGVEELEIEAGGERVFVRRAGATPASTAALVVPTAAAPDAASVVVCAPAVGLFHRGTEEGAPPLVAEGATVTRGQLVGVVEVLRMPHPVEAPRAGVVGRFLVESGQAVEYGQPLLELEPEA